MVAPWVPPAIVGIMPAIDRRRIRERVFGAALGIMSTLAAMRELDMREFLILGRGLFIHPVCTMAIEDCFEPLAPGAFAFAMFRVRQFSRITRERIERPNASAPAAQPSNLPGRSANRQKTPAGKGGRRKGETRACR